MMPIISQYRKAVRRLAVRAFCLAMVTLAVWSGACVPGAMAVGSEKAGAVVSERAAAELDRVAGSGTSDFVEGAAQGVAGKAQRDIGGVKDQFSDSPSNQVDSATDRLGGAANQVTGKVKRDVGRAKGAAADTADDIEDGAEGVVESIKDFFN